MPHCLLTAGELCIEFRCVDDRWSHEVFVQSTSGPSRLLSSIEGTLEDDWPPSPPLQELHSAGAGAPLLLVGMAGRSHWSMSAEAERAARRITLDVACRTSGGGPLGSSYEVAAGVSWHLQSCEVRPAGLNWALKVAVDSGVSSECQLLSRDDGGFRFDAGTIPGTSSPQTVRWKYTLELVDF